MSYYRMYAGTYENDEGTIRVRLQGRRRPILVTTMRKGEDGMWFSGSCTCRTIDKRIDAVAAPYMRGGWRRIAGPAEYERESP